MGYLNYRKPHALKQQTLIPPDLRAINIPLDVLAINHTYQHPQSFSLSCFLNITSSSTPSTSSSSPGLDNFLLTLLFHIFIHLFTTTIIFSMRKIRTLNFFLDTVFLARRNDDTG